jgi:DNA-binding CsgD family transcriptional regulator
VRSVGTSDFVGRQTDLDDLVAAFDAACGGRSATILVSGDAGIGKSRLVDEFCDRMRLRGAVAATGHCLPAEGALPYGPVVGMLRDLSRRSGETPTLEVLGSLDSAAGAADTASSPDEYPTSRQVADELTKIKIFEAILDVVETISCSAPLILVFEDVQWADSASAQCIDFLTRNLRGARVLVIATHRREDILRDHPLRLWLMELSRHPQVRRLDLDGLERADVDMLISGIVGRMPDRGVRDVIWTRSQGNPFFVEELAAAQNPLLPSQLQALILGRVDGLSDNARTLLKVMSAGGAVVTHRLMSAVGILADDLIEPAVLETLDRQLVVTEDALAAYRFRHALLREAVYANLLATERVRLHHAIAEALAAEPGMSAVDAAHRGAELAAHWWAAQDFVQVVPASLAAADSAVAVLAFPEALTQLEHVLVAIDRAPEALEAAGVTRLRVFERLADVAYLAGANARAVELAEAAVQLSETDGDVRATGRCLVMLGRAHWSGGDSAAAFGAYRRATELLPVDPPSAERARVLAEDARGLMLMSRFRDGEVRSREAIDAARAAGARAEEGHAINTLGCCLDGLGRSEEGIALIRESLVIAEDLASPDDVSRGYANLSATLLNAGKLEQAAALVFDSAAVGEELWGTRLQGASGNSVEALTRLGRYGDALALLAEIGDSGMGMCAGGPYLYPAAVRILTGDFGEAARLLEIADRITAGLGDVQNRGQYFLSSAELALALGRPSDASDHVTSGLELAREGENLEVRARLCAVGIRRLADAYDDTRSRGQEFDLDTARRDAADLIAELGALAADRTGEDLFCPPEVSALAAQCVAEKARLATPDPSLWRSAGELWDVAGEPYPVAYCAWREAATLLASRTNRVRALECLQRAWEIALQLGARPLQARIESLGQLARVQLREPDAAAQPSSTLAQDFGLTAREIEVLGRLADGLTDREIAETLFISKKTASVHVSNLLRKLGVGNRVEAGRVGQSHGLVVAGKP